MDQSHRVSLGMQTQVVGQSSWGARRAACCHQSPCCSHMAGQQGGIKNLVTALPKGPVKRAPPARPGCLGEGERAHPPQGHTGGGCAGAAQPGCQGTAASSQQQQRPQCAAQSPRAAPRRARPRSATGPLATQTRHPSAWRSHFECRTGGTWMSRARRTPAARAQ